VWPIAELAELAHAAGAEIFVDAAQLAPHRPIDLQALGVDHLAVSGHKLYAPFGTGALVARRSRLAAAEPWLKGGGAVRRVTLEATVWADPPDSHEAGSPNTIGAVALGAACDALAGVGMDIVAAHERTLTARLRAGLSELPGVHLLDLWPEGACDRLGVATFMVDGFPDRLLAQILAAEHGVGVRNGRFCAHPFVGELIRRNHDTAGAASAADDGRGPGAVRASLGVASCEDDVDRLLAALGEIITSGPAGKYVPAPDVNDYVLADDQRAWPELSFRLNTPRPVPPCG
jgi:selenocysteine lyase/cysteine desulfurase